MAAKRKRKSWADKFNEEVRRRGEAEDRIPVGNRRPGQKFTMDDGTTVTTELVEFFPSKGLKGAPGSRLKRVRNAMLKKHCTVMRFEADRRTATWYAKAYRASTNPGVRVFVVSAKTMSRTDWGRRLTDMWGGGLFPAKDSTHAVVACTPRRRK